MALVVLEALAGIQACTALAGNLTRQGFISDLKAAGVPPTQYGDALDEVRSVVLTRDPGDRSSARAGQQRRRLLRLRLQHHDARTGPFCAAKMGPT